MEIFCFYIASSHSPLFSGSVLKNSHWLVSKVLSHLMCACMHVHFRIPPFKVEEYIRTMSKNNILRARHIYARLIFTFRWRIFPLYGDVTIASEGLLNLSLCSVLEAFEQGGIFIVPHLLWHGLGGFFFRSHRNRRTAPLQSPLTTHKGMWMIYSNPNPHGSAMSRKDF
jgi:hypothetical protein